MPSLPNFDQGWKGRGLFCLLMVRTTKSAQKLPAQGGRRRGRGVRNFGAKETACDMLSNNSLPV